MKVLLVEDSPALQQSVGTALRRSGFAVDVTGDGKEGLWYATSNPYDVLILDIMLPGLDGLSILKDVRKKAGGSQVLMLTAKDAVDDRVAGLNHGADDYLTKPFALQELIARVQALCRRRYQRRAPAIAIGDLEIDTVGRSVSRAGKAIALTPREFAILEYLAGRPGEVVSRTDIEANIYDENAEVMSNVVDTAIYALRKKLSAAGGAPLIETRRGQGYVLAGGPDP